MSTNKILGKDLILEVKDNGTTLVLGGNTTCSLDLSGNTIDDTTKDDENGWESSMLASLGWSISWEGLIVKNDSNETNAERIIDAMIGRKELTATFKIGSASYSGKGILTASNYSGAVKDLGKTTFTLQGRGAMAKVVAVSGTSQSNG